MKEKFWSHIYKDIDKERRKRIKSHNKGILNITENAFYKPIFLDYFKLIKVIIILHDLGKYTDFFQNYLVSGKRHPKNWQFHSYFGAVTAWNKLKGNYKIGLIAYFIIKYHHANLDDVKNCYYLIYDNSGENHTARKKRLVAQKDNIVKYLTLIEQESNYHIGKENLGKEIPNLSSETKLISDERNIENYFLINYLFSLLIEADKLDASRTKQYIRNKLSENLVQNHILKLTNGKIDENDLRNIARESVLSNLKNEAEILKTKLFTLTAPTGIGKTLTILDFAIKLRTLLPSNPQIIYGLPFINIIEQAIEVYNEVIPKKEDGKVLAHYQYADVLGQQEKYDEEQEDKNYEQKLKTLDCWQSDIVITTFVQVLQTIIGNKNSMLKRFNHFAGAILILDEVQTIRLGYQPLIGAALYYLAKFLDTRIIMMTATKPKIFELANHFLLEPDNEKAVAKELLEGYKKIFKQKERTAIYPKIKKGIVDEKDFLDNYFTKYWEENQSCLLVCNKVRRSVDLYKTIKNYIEKNELPNNVYYLSTNIVPCDRLYVIDKVKLDIKHGKKSILISTQSIEAGVDLDFDMGFRDLAPIDSIVQVAGRINRNDEKAKFSKLYIIKFVNEKDKSDCESIYDPITESQAIKALRKLSNGFTNEIQEPKYLELVEEYYDLLTDTENPKTSFDDSIKIFESMKMLRYDGEVTKEIMPVSAFKVIEEKGYAISVFIEIDDYSKEIGLKYKRLVDSTDKDFGREKFEKYKKDFHQRIIAVPKYTKNAEELLKYADKNESFIMNEKLYCVPKEYLTEFYDFTTGFIRTPEDKVDAHY